MLVLDVNVVIAAHRVDHTHHTMMSRWFRAVASGAEAFSVPHVVWASFVRLVTNRHAFRTPTPRDRAFAFVDAVRAHHNHRSLEPGPRHLALLRLLCEESDATGDLVADAVIAAIALEHGCAVASLDRDFARFSSIDHIIPGAHRE
ncbi:MAG: PIN domain-containing protein [Actinomycetota bacterium]|nr:PIN domain-containing protein [Actinomycetota bacterium]